MSFSSLPRILLRIDELDKHSELAARLKPGFVLVAVDWDDKLVTDEVPLMVRWASTIRRVGIVDWIWLDNQEEDLL